MRASPRDGGSALHATSSCSRLCRTYTNVLVLAVAISTCFYSSAARLPPGYHGHTRATSDAPGAGPSWQASALQPQTSTLDASGGAEGHWSVFDVASPVGLRRLQADPSPGTAQKSQPGTGTNAPAQLPGATQPATKPVPAEQQAADRSGTAEDDSEARTFMLREMRDEELLGVHNFNGALMAVDQQGNYTYNLDAHAQKVLMVYRASETTHSFSQILMAELHPHTFEPITEAGISVITYRGRHEDPRLFTWQGQLWMSSTTIRHRVAGKVAFNLIEGKTAGPPFILDLNDKHGKRPEKSWTPFPHNGTLKLVYSIQPLRVYAADLATLETKLVLTHEGWNSQGPEFRGGAPPVLAGGRYYLFVHSKRPGYEVHAVVLDAASLRVVAYSPQPVIRRGADRILFPCGALYTPATERFAIAMGINDRFIGIVQISKRHVDQHLVAVQ